MIAKLERALNTLLKIFKGTHYNFPYVIMINPVQVMHLTRQIGNIVVSFAIFAWIVKVLDPIISLTKQPLLKFIAQTL